MSFDFNDAQLAAIRSRGENLLVAAGAGSGKTTVLVNRLVRRLAEGGEAGRLLVLTFTRAAADDMRAKIDAAFRELLQERPDDRHLRRQLALLPQAQISTVHSFCLELLKRYYYCLGLPAGFRVASDMEAALMRQEVLDDFLEEEYSRPDSALPELADAYGGPRDDSRLVKMMLELYDYSLSRPDPAGWLEEAAAAFDSVERVDDYLFADYFSGRLAFRIAMAARPFEQARELTFSAVLPLVWRELINNEIAMLHTVREKTGLSARLAALRSVSFERLPAGKNKLRAGMSADAVFDEAAMDRFRVLRTEGREAVKKLRDRYAIADDGQYVADMRAVAPLLRQLTGLIARFDAALHQEKLRRGLIDYSDMEHLTLRLLGMEDIAAELRQGYDEVLVDEYQDINEVQESIFAALSRGDNFFAVGDVKQSIYRFRLAEPRLFLDKYQRYGQHQDGRRIDLNDNYRSDGHIIQGVNFLFRQLMYAEAAELDYDGAAELKAGRDTVGAAAELHLLDMSAVVNDGDGDDLTMSQAEARMLALRIAQLRQEGYQYGDMAILLRSLKRDQQIYIEELARAGIPVLAGEGEQQLDSPEQSLIIALLCIIDNPRQDIPLAAVLRSLLFAFSDDELARLRLDHREGDLYQAVCAQSQGEGPLAEKARAFLEQLQKWRMLAGMERMDRLLLTVYQDSGIYRLLAALPHGEQRAQRLDQLYNEAHQYDESGYAGLFRFIRLLSESRERGFKRPMAQQQADAVRLLSVHKSKGLEFPVVFAAGLNSHFNFRDEYEDLIWERSLGLGARRVDLENRCKYPTLSHMAVAQKMREQALAEEMRVLYVALTRARERLILSAGLRDLPSELDACKQVLSGDIIGPRLPLYAVAAATKPLDWLLPALLRHEDAAELRRLAHMEDISVLPDQGNWRICLHGPGELTLPGPLTAAPAEVDIDEVLQQAVEAACSFRYEGRERCDQPVKWTVSELNRQALAAQEAEETAVLPITASRHVEDGDGIDEAINNEAIINNGDDKASEKAEARRYDAARRGTVYHELLQNADPSDADEAALARLSRDLMAQGRYSPEEAALVDLSALADFFRSPLGQRMAKAEKLQRETPFTLAEDAQQPDGIIIQGMLDAAFLEEDGWVLLDYKTGGRGKSDGELRRLYQAQIDWYALAIQRIWRKPVKQRYLVMLDLRRCVEL